MESRVTPGRMISDIREEVLVGRGRSRRGEEGRGGNATNR